MIHVHQAPRKRFMVYPGRKQPDDQYHETLLGIIHEASRSPDAQSNFPGKSWLPDVRDNRDPESPEVQAEIVTALAEIRGKKNGHTEEGH